MAEGHAPLAYRYFFLQAHYRKQQTFTDEAGAQRDPIWLRPGHPAQELVRAAIPKPTTEEHAEALQAGAEHTAKDLLELETIAARLGELYPETNQGWTVVVDTLHERLVHENRALRFYVRAATDGEASFTVKAVATDASLVEVNPLIVTKSGDVIALDAKNGDVLWSFASGGSVISGAAIVDGVVELREAGVVVARRRGDGRLHIHAHEGIQRLAQVVAHAEGGGRAMVAVGNVGGVEPGEGLAQGHDVGRDVHDPEGVADAVDRGEVDVGRGGHDGGRAADAGTHRNQRTEMRSHVIGQTVIVPTGNLR